MPDIPKVTYGVRYITHDLIKKLTKEDDLSNVKKLEIILAKKDGKKIKFIENLELLKNLNELNIATNIIERIEHLDRLTLLTHLNLSSNRIACIENIQYLINLKTLLLSDNRIQTIPVWLPRKCKCLQVIDISKNLIESLSEIIPLKKLVDIYDLRIDDNPVSQQLHHARHLVIFHITTLSCLDGVPVTQDERLLATERFSQEELLKLSNEVSEKEISIQKLQKELSSSQTSNATSRKSLLSVKKDLKSSNTISEDLQKELDSNKDLLLKKSQQLSVARRKHYELEQEIAFYKIDHKFDTLTKVSPPTTDISFDEQQEDSPYFGSTRFSKLKRNISAKKVADPLNVEIPIKELQKTKVLQTELNSLQNEYDAKMEMISKAKEQLNDLEKRLTFTNNQTTNATQQLFKVTQQLPQSERRLYQEDLGQQFKVMTRLQSQLMATNGKLMNSKRDIVSLQKGTESLQLKVQLEEMLAQQKGEMRARRKEFEEEQEKQDSLISSISMTTKKIENLENSLANTDKALSDSLETGINTLCAKVQETINCRKNEIDGNLGLANEIARLEYCLDETKAEKNKYKDDLIHFRNRSVKADDNMNKLNSDLDIEHHRNFKTREILHEMDDEIKKNNDIKFNLEHEINKLSKEIQTERNIHEDEMQRLKQQLLLHCDASKQLNSAVSDVENLKLQIDNLKNSEFRLSNDNKTLADDLEKYQGAVANKVDTIDGLRSELTRVNNLLSESQQNAEDDFTKMQKDLQRNTRIMNKYKDLANDNNVNDQELQSLHTTLSDLQRANTALQDKIYNLECELKSKPKGHISADDLKRKLSKITNNLKQGKNSCGITTDTGTEMDEIDSALNIIQLEVDNKIDEAENKMKDLKEDFSQTQNEERLMAEGVIRALIETDQNEINKLKNEILRLKAELDNDSSESDASTATTCYHVTPTISSHGSTNSAEWDERKQRIREELTDDERYLFDELQREIEDLRRLLAEFGLEDKASAIDKTVDLLSDMVAERKGQGHGTMRTSKSGRSTDSIRHSLRASSKHNQMYPSAISSPNYRRELLIEPRPRRKRAFIDVKRRLKSILGPNSGASLSDRNGREETAPSGGHSKSRSSAVKRTKQKGQDQYNPNNNPNDKYEINEFPDILTPIYKDDGNRNRSFKPQPERNENQYSREIATENDEQNYSRSLPFTSQATSEGRWMNSIPYDNEMDYELRDKDEIQPPFDRDTREAGYRDGMTCQQPYDERTFQYDDKVDRGTANYRQESGNLTSDGRDRCPTNDLNPGDPRCSVHRNDAPGNYYSSLQPPYPHDGLRNGETRGHIGGHNPQGMQNAPHTVRTVGILKRGQDYRQFTPSRIVNGEQPRFDQQHTRQDAEQRYLKDEVEQDTRDGNHHLRYAEPPAYRSDMMTSDCRVLPPTMDWSNRGDHNHGYPTSLGDHNLGYPTPLGDRNLGYPTSLNGPGNDCCQLFCNIPGHSDLLEQLFEVNTKMDTYKERQRLKKENIIQLKALNTIKELCSKLKDRKDELVSLDLSHNSQKSHYGLLQNIFAEISDQNEKIRLIIDGSHNDNRFEDSPEIDCDDIEGDLNNVQDIAEQTFCLEETLSRRRSEFRSCERLLSDSRMDAERSQDKVKQMLLDISMYDENINEKKTLLEGIKVALEKAESDALQLEERSNVAEKNSEKVESRIVEANTIIDDIDKLLNSKDQQFQNIQLNIDESSKRTIELRNEINNLKCEYQGHEVNMNTNEQLINEQNKEIDDLNHYIERSKEEILKLDENYKEIEMKLDEVKSTLDSKSSNLISVEKDLDEMIKKKRKEINQLTSLQDMTSSQLNKSRSVTPSISEVGVNEEITKLKDEVGDLKSENGKLIFEIDELKMSKSVTTIATVQSVPSKECVLKTTKRNQLLSDEYKQLQTDVREANLQIKQLEELSLEKNNSWRKVKINYEDKISKQEIESKELHKQKRTIEDNFKTFKEQSDTMKSHLTMQIDDRNTKYKILCKQLQMIQNDLTDKKKEISDIVTKSGNKLRDVEKKCHDNISRVGDVTEQLSSLRKQHQQTQIDLESERELTKDYNSIRNELKQFKEKQSTFEYQQETEQNLIDEQDNLKKQLEEMMLSHTKTMEKRSNDSLIYRRNIFP